MDLEKTSFTNALWLKHQETAVTKAIVQLRLPSVIQNIFCTITHEYTQLITWNQHAHVYFFRETGDYRLCFVLFHLFDFRRKVFLFGRLVRGQGLPWPWYRNSFVETRSKGSFYQLYVEAQRTVSGKIQ